MRLNIEQVRRRIDAVIGGRDDRLIVLLRCQPQRLRQPELLHWLRSLLRSYDDDLELAVHICDATRQPAIAARTDSSSRIARRLQRLELPVTVAAGDLRQDPRLAALAAWTIRWSFDPVWSDATALERAAASSAALEMSCETSATGSGALPRVRAGGADGDPVATATAAVATVAGAAGFSVRPGIVVPPGLVYGEQIATRCHVAGASGDAEAMLVDMTSRPGRTAHARELARSVGEIISFDAVRIVGAFLDATPGSTEPHVLNLADRNEGYEWSTCNVDAVEATLDVLANAVRQRRLSVATRARGSLWRRF
jgi:hypothetical protein